MLSQYPYIRVAIYVLAIASQIASFFVVLVDKDLALAFVSTSTLLTGVAGYAALSNLSPARHRAE